jgi:hypothetical protein
MLNSEITFIIPTKAADLESSAYPTWKSIREHYPNAPIYIVDSDSPYKDYAKLVADEKTTVLFDKNKNYDIGAYLHGITKDQFQSNAYVCIHDSVTLKKALKINGGEVGCFYRFRSFDGIGESWHTSRIRTKNKIWGRYKIQKYQLYGFDNDDQRTFTIRNINKLNLSMPEYFSGVFGPMFYINKYYAKKLVSDFANLDLPTNKNEQKAFERIVGIYLQQNRIDLRENAIEGEYLSSHLDESIYINKTIRNRA